MHPGMALHIINLSTLKAEAVGLQGAGVEAVGLQGAGIEAERLNLKVILD